MGIPFYFKNVVRNNPGVIRSKLSGCDRLYLDFNSIIHVCSQKVVASRIWKNNRAMEEAIFKSITQYTDHVVEVCPPRQLLYIAVDGVAPLAKIMQQRRRRHMSAMRNQKINEFKQTHSIPSSTWDSNCITPGTEFMHKLQTHLSAYYKSHKSSFEIILSSHEEVGEGEHKIIDYIKLLGNDGFVDVIYGLDADLMMLAITCNKPNIYLMREATHVVSNKQHIDGFKYVDIDYLAKCICNGNERDESALRNYVFMCFMIGNDFLPHFPSLSLKSNGLDILHDILHGVNGMHAIMFDDKMKKFTVNLDFWMHMFEKLSRDEESLLSANIALHETKLKHKLDTTGPSPIDTFINELEATPVLHAQRMPGNHSIKWDPRTDPTNWKSHYYMQNGHEIRLDDVESMDRMCLNFLRGLVWNVDYYFNGIASNHWYYMYRFAPCLSDVYAYLKKVKTSNSLHILFEKTFDVAHTLTPLQQLLMVLPYQSLHMLPKKLQEKACDVSNGMLYMYPLQFQVDMHLKTQLWECTPILPDVDVKKVLDITCD